MNSSARGLRPSVLRTQNSDKLIPFPKRVQGRTEGCLDRIHILTCEELDFLHFCHSAYRKERTDRCRIPFMKCAPACCSTGINPRSERRNPPARVGDAVRAGGHCVSERRFNAVNKSGTNSEEE